MKPQWTQINTIEHNKTKQNTTQQNKTKPNTKQQSITITTKVQRDKT